MTVTPGRYAPRQRREIEARLAAGELLAVVVIDAPIRPITNASRRVSRVSVFPERVRRYPRVSEPVSNQS